MEGVTTPKKGMEVQIPPHVFHLDDGTKTGTAKVLDIEDCDVVVQFKDGAQGICQIYEIPDFQHWCGRVIEKYLEEE